MKFTNHIIFWLAVLVLLTTVFSTSYNSVSEAFYFVSMLLPVVVGTCYFFNLYLVPRFLLTKKYFKFVLYSIYMLVMSLYLEMVVIFISFIFLAEYSYDNMSPVSSDIFVLTVTLYFIVLLFSFVLLIRRSYIKENTIAALNNEKVKNLDKSFTVRSDRQIKNLIYDEVLYIESMGDYVRINLQSGETVITKEKISKLEERLPEIFVRIHRSFIIHKHKVSSLTKESLSIGELSLPISRTFKKEAWEKLTQKISTK